MYNEDMLKKARKLKALAENGVGGEQANARELLDKMMEAHDIAASDIEDEPLDIYYFSYHGRWEKALLAQLFSKIVPDRLQYHKCSGKDSRSSWGCKCTEAEKLEIQYELDFYCKLWEEELSLFFSAFVQKHKIFNARPGHHAEEVDPETLERMLAMMEILGDDEPAPLLDRHESAPREGPA